MALTTLFGTGCDNSTRASQEASQSLHDALADYGSIASSHLATSDVKGPPQVAYNMPTALGADWPDLSLLAARQDQYDVLAKRFQELAQNPAASNAEHALALLVLSDIQHRGARYLLRRADLDRTTELRMMAGLHAILGKIELQALAQNPPQAQNTIQLLEQGEASGIKSTSLTDLAKARDAAGDAYEKIQAQLDAITKDKAETRAKADDLFARASDLQLSVRHVAEAKRFDILDQASMARRDAEIAEAALFSQDQELDALTRQLQFWAKTKVALEQSIALCQASLAAAKEAQKSTNDDLNKNSDALAALHTQWLTEAKVKDGQFSDKVAGPLAKALAAAQTAQATLAKAIQADGAVLTAKGDAGAINPLEFDQAYIAVTLAQIQTLRLRALDAHKQALLGLANREKVWIDQPDAGFIDTRVAELAKDEDALVKPATEACAAALAAIGTSESTAGLKTNVEAYRKTIKELSEGPGPAAEVKGEAKPETPAKTTAAPEANPQPPAAETPAPDTTN